LFKQLLWEKRRNESETPLPETEQTAAASGSTDEATKITPRPGSILTWGDMLTNTFFSSRLFPESRTKGTPSIYIDRYSLNQAGIVPSSPIRWRENPNPRSKGLGALEDAGLILLFLNANTVFVTTAAAEVKYRHDLIPLCGDCVWYPRSKAFADSLLNSFVQNRDSNVVPAWFWRNENIGSTSPWVPTLRGTRLLSETPRWNAREFSLADAVAGVVVSDWHRLVAEKWFFFIAVFALTFRRPRPGSIIPFFLVLLVGMTGIISCAVSSTYIYPLEGILFGALFSLACYAVRSLRTMTPEIPVAESVSTSTPPAVIVDDDETESSVPGFVQINTGTSSGQHDQGAAIISGTSGSEANLRQTKDTQPSQPLSDMSDSQDVTHIVNDDVIVRSITRKPHSDSQGRTTLFTLLVLVTTISIVTCAAFILCPPRVSGHTDTPVVSEAAASAAMGSADASPRTGGNQLSTRHPAFPPGEYAESAKKETKTQSPALSVPKAVPPASSAPSVTVPNQKATVTPVPDSASSSERARNQNEPWR
ncbi:MAG: hypothetical protein Q4G59_13045, partial [Planctomycetia bacterium]|nr:hypothetical protein [Planctomycetia bacterium]